MYRFVRESEGLARRREQRRFMVAQGTSHHGAVGPASQCMCSESSACTHAPRHQAGYAKEGVLHCPRSSLRGCWDFSRQQSQLCSLCVPKSAWFAPLYSPPSWHAARGGQHQQNLNAHWQIFPCRQVLVVECTKSALAAVVDTPTTWTAHMQWKMHFPHGKGERRMHSQILVRLTGYLAYHRFFSIFEIKWSIVNGQLNGGFMGHRNKLLMLAWCDTIFFRKIAKTM